MTPTLLPAWRAALLPLALAWPLASMAQQPAVTAPHSVQMRAGPDPSYPIVAVLPPRVGVTVFGCLEGYTWCDVGAGYDRGWVYAGNLRYYYQSQYVPLVGIASVVGIGFTAFAFNDYWGRHYRDRRWYDERDHWYRGAARPGFVPGPRPDHFARPPERMERRDQFNRPEQFARPEHFGRPDQPIRPVPPAAPIAVAPGQHGQRPQGLVQVQPVPPARALPPGHGGVPPGHGGTPPGQANGHGNRGEGHGGGHHEGKGQEEKH